MVDKKRMGTWLLVALVVGLLLCVLLYSRSRPSRSWSGVDEAVVEKIAREHGREARPPLIDPGSGDLLLFVFLLAGAAGGFVAGYYWRTLFKGRGE